MATLQSLKRALASISMPSHDAASSGVDHEEDGIKQPLRDDASPGVDHEEDGIEQPLRDDVTYGVDHEEDGIKQPLRDDASSVVGHDEEQEGQTNTPGRRRSHNQRRRARRFRNIVQIPTPENSD